MTGVAATDILQALMLQTGARLPLGIPDDDF